ncbi:uncharacterized protein ACRADG_012118 [Cochliomyia hominivorax]
MQNNGQTENNVVRLECDNFYQISDDDLDDCEDLPDDCLLDTTDASNNPNSSTALGNNNNNGHPRGPYERAWTTEATRALIHVRGPMESRFSEGRQKRTALWLHCTRQLQKMGFRYSAAKVQKKWHNILITYNKNLCKKYTCGYVHWEFFEEMFKYLQGKRANFETPVGNKQLPPLQMKTPTPENFNIQYVNAKDDEVMSAPQQIELDSKSNDDFDEEDSTTMSDMKKPKMELNDDNQYEYPLQIIETNNYPHANAQGEQIDNEFPKNFGKEQMFVESGNNGNASWWQDYFERKLQVERDKIELQREMHKELMQFNKMSLLQQEKIERVKIEAINSLTSTLQKLVEVKYKKTN